MENFKNPSERLYYHNSNINKWLSRYKNTVPADYLYKPKDKIRCIELKQIFDKFDEDQSNTLELEEFFDMFRENYLDSIFTNVEEKFKEYYY